MVYNPETGADDFAPCSLTIAIDASNFPEAAKSRMADLLNRAKQTEIVFMLNSLLLHRRKASLGESSIPMFIGMVASDIYAKDVSSLGVQILGDTLRKERKNQWFPEWDEIEMLISPINKAVKKLKEQVCLKADMIDKVKSLEQTATGDQT